MSAACCNVYHNELTRTKACRHNLDMPFFPFTEEPNLKDVHTVPIDIHNTVSAIQGANRTLVKDNTKLTNDIADLTKVNFGRTTLTSK